MSAFDRNWTLQLQTSKEKFCNAFYDVVNKDSNKLVVQNLGLANSIVSDFYGTVRNETFSIWKRKGIFDLNSTGLILDGKMTADSNYLTLELRIINNLVFNYLRIFITAIPVTAIIFFLLIRLISIIQPIPGTYFAVYSFSTVPVLFIGVFYTQVKIIGKYLDNLKNLYNEVLKKIEEQANSK